MVRIISRRAISNDFLWVIGFVIVVLIVGVAWISFMVRAADTVIITQEYVARNLAYLSTMVLASPGITSYTYSSDSANLLHIQYDKTLVSVATLNKNIGTEYVSPTASIHPFPDQLTLDVQENILGDIFFTSIKDALIVSAQPIADTVCLHYTQFPFENTDQNILLLAAPEYTSLIETVVQRAPHIDTKPQQGKEYAVLILLNKKSQNQNTVVRLATPDLKSKRIACIFAEELAATLVQEDISLQGFTDIGLTSDTVGNSRRTILSIDAASFDAEKLSSAVSKIEE